MPSGEFKFLAELDLESLRGSGKSLARVYLKNGFGGLVLCAKPDEKDTWIRYAQDTGREEDLILFSKDSKYEFNPLDYELTREGKGAGDVFNLSYLFMEIYKMGIGFPVVEIRVKANVSGKQRFAGVLTE